MAKVMDAEGVPKPIESGPEMDALRRFVPDAVTWKGTIREGRMGPDTPEMKGIGRGAAKVIQDGRWIVGDYEQDQFLDDGTFVLRWRLHWISGWAPQHGEYRASMADNYENTGVYRGRIEREGSSSSRWKAGERASASRGMPLNPA